MLNYLYKFFLNFGKYTPVVGIFNLFKFGLFKISKTDKFIKFKINHFGSYFYFRSISDESALPRLSEGYFFVKPNFIVKEFIECGSTIGMTSLHFMAAYNQANITLLEPVKDNFELLKKNLSMFQKVKILEIGLSNKNCFLSLGKESKEKRSINFSKYYSKQLSEKSEFIDINKFFDKYNLTNTDIIHININGAEVDLFEDISWIKHCKIIIVYIFNIHQNNTNLIIKKLVNDNNYDLNFEIYNFHLIISHKKYSYSVDTIKLK